jgi:GntR family transcriptional repressor for pyruvate dehydrogenase complex
VKDTLSFRLNRKSLVAQIADRIESMIVGRSLTVGHRLPSERALADSLAVSRPVIREATRVLAERGLVQVKPGSGAYISSPGAGAATASLSLFMKLQQNRQSFQDYCEVRESLEIDIAGLAAERADEQDIADLQRILTGMRKHQNDGVKFVRLDLEFHTRLAEATRNPLYHLLMIPIQEIQHSFRLNSYKADKQAALHGGLYYHTRILDCVKRHDATAAREEMRAHLQQARTLLENALSKAEN